MGIAALLLDDGVSFDALRLSLAAPGPCLAVVVDADDRPLGIVDLAELANYLALGSAPEMTRRVTPVHESAVLAHAIDRMVHERARAIPVVDDQDRVVGLLTDLDALRWVSRHGGR